MSVIARKIAVAQAPVQESTDATDVARPIAKDLTQALSEWLGVEEAETELRSAEHVLRPAEALPEFIILCRGTRRNRLVALGVSKPLTEMATRAMLGIEAMLDDAALEALRPFMAQNLLSLGERFNDSDMMELSGHTDPVWTVETREDVAAEFARHDGAVLDMVLLDGEGGDMSVVLMATQAMLPELETAEASETDAAPRMAPRLGPCHVEVRAVADRVRMSVADCTRLEIGQVVALPGLRFDTLELTVDMDDGPRPLTDAALGADKGVKAVRLNRGLDPAFRAAPPEGAPVAPSAPADLAGLQEAVPA